ncbi:hypothetical protein PoB_003959500 [Plakobranchus ocellatus]|uniref:Uncharacterized protein n=1 Tax=Plakobranchus ocellatus TaxID=259542 RepID=A0AAV4AXJ7_9GAST|nr:hypothetical protein PoB_003959500 [Plakobranchus ocellatus]
MFTEEIYKRDILTFTLWLSLAGPWLKTYVTLRYVIDHNAKATSTNRTPRRSSRGEELRTIADSADNWTTRSTYTAVPSSSQVCRQHALAATSCSDTACGRNKTKNIN